MTANWSNVYADVNVTVQPPPITTEPFGTPVFCSSDTDFGGDAYRTYNTLAAVAADSDLSSSAKAALTAMLSAEIAPNTVACIPVDTGDPTPYPTALQAAVDAGLDFVYVTIQSRAAATIVIVSDWCEARDYILIAQSSDSSWLNSGVPSGFTTIVDNDQTGVVYHPTDTQWADAEYAGFAAAVNPNNSFAFRFKCPIGTATAYDLTETQRNFALANYCNVISPLTVRSTNREAGEGVALSGEKLYAAEIRIWTKVTLTDKIMSTIQKYHAVGNDLPKNDVGIAIVIADCQEVGVTGLARQCFTRSATLPDGYLLSGEISGDNIVITATYGLLDSVDQVVVNASLARV